MDDKVIRIEGNKTYIIIFSDEVPYNEMKKLMRGIKDSKLVGMYERAIKQVLCIDPKGKERDIEYTKDNKIEHHIMM